LVEIEVIYKDGVFRPIGNVKLSLPEGARVKIVLKPSIEELFKVFEGVRANGNIDEVFAEMRRREVHG